MTATLDSTPAADGYRMPAEWEPHEGCWMAWPHRHDNWREEAGPAQRAFAAVAGAIAQSEPVTVAAAKPQLEHARELLPAEVRVVEIPTDDAWMRDIGPSFVVDGAGAKRGVDWRFNAWGGLYEHWDHDEAAAARVLEIEQADRYRAPLVLEGGSIHVDGEGTVLTTEECLLNPNRNPDLGRAEIERLLCAYLGATRVIWLGRGLPHDETDGHIDNLACFVAPGVVLLTDTDDRGDELYEVCADARRRLQSATDARGRPLEVIPIRAPGAISIEAHEAAGISVVAGTHPRHAGDPMAASYVNFYPANNRIVFPLLDPDHDEQAAAVLRKCFPGREVLGVPGREILLGGGNIHCITQQVPRAL
ncbi:MAG: agmatine deiminase [Solirubrobacteraceae bacterium]|jgi:agmatine deiminase|nr:agmatine deiminase [Solirubrobacterales bacterium]MEA2215901.1 agmatine deiminase [Solirubrobacteraceae bacterium]